MGKNGNDDTASQLTRSDAVTDAMRGWIETTVIGLNLCPFAALVMRRELLRIDALDDASIGRVQERLLRISRLLLCDSEQDVTALLVLATGYADYDRFIELVHSSEQYLEGKGFNGLIQLASFHPDYCFAGASHDDPANWTNRSPYPALHILTEASVTRSVCRFGDTVSIPRRNVALLRLLGEDFVTQLMGSGGPSHR